MPSVTGLLEERERSARQRVEILEAKLQEAEGRADHGARRQREAAERARPMSACRVVGEP